MRAINLALALSATILCSVAMAAAEPVDYRLPPAIRPSAQSIELRLDPALADYSGSTVLQVDISSTVERIGIYQLGLDMTSITLSSGTGKRTLEATVGDYDINWLFDGAVIPAGSYELRIEFSGRYATDSLGMHRVRFEGNDYVFTQMESMYLRRAIPSFDEPSFKIPYTLTIEAPAGLVVVANTPVASQTEADGWQRVEFLPTKPLSSYLVAYAVGPLDSAPIEGMSVPGRIYVPKGHAGETGFITRNTAKVVRGLEDYFGTSYPFRKLDFLAVPEFAYGAMENPGLVTWRTDVTLVGDEVGGRLAAGILSGIAHEVGHMWFGDLVTMAWWNDLWLNEAFASWVDDTMMERLFPEFESELDLPQSKAFPIDYQTGVKPIRKVTRSEADVNEGQYLPYVKGLTILKMLEYYVGRDVWQTGIRKYLQKFAWGNATESDLWDVMSEVSGKDINQIASGYFNQPGYPLLSIDANGTVKQTRYVAAGTTAPELQWVIPLNVKYRKNGKVHEVFYLLDGKVGQLDVPAGADWILPDAGGNGYYRWQIDTDQFYALVDDLASLANREKIALLDNSKGLLQANKLSLEDYLLVLAKMLHDPHPLVLLAAVEKTMLIGDELVDADNAAAFARFVDAELGDRFAAVGVETRAGDSEALLQLRPRLVRLMGQYGANPAVRAAIAAQARLYLASADAVETNLAREILRTAALNDDGGLYPRYVKSYMESTNADQKTNILAAMYFSDPAIARQALDFFLTDAVPAGDAILGPRFLAGLLDDQTVLYDWLAVSIEALENKVPSYMRQSIPRHLVGTCTDINLALLQGFFADRGERYAASLDNATETLRNCIARRKRDGPALLKFLARYDRPVSR